MVMFLAENLKILLSASIAFDRSNANGLIRSTGIYTLSTAGNNFFTVFDILPYISYCDLPRTNNSNFHK